jgi:long-chain acyl-CoA synthetase
MWDIEDPGRKTPALVSAERSISWRELEEESERLARGYRSLGLEPGDRVASLMPNRIALLVHYLACFKGGLVVTPLNYRYTFREIDHALEVSGAKGPTRSKSSSGGAGASRKGPSISTA